ncbi:hypothetical protein HanXRQr2_Chr12g0527471 [Helianthus annuus]|uniref:Putative NAD(P)-binding domain-containing protein n=1 Tax=Helianthus annuus TaxID=4232 RepID=A0A251SZC7_HELAN|nr:hypothetical protein HanXRQr2_Chr12g0527471 [Helianthus annuus]
MDFVKATLESDTRVLASEARRKHKTRGNTTSAGPTRTEFSHRLEKVGVTLSQWQRSCQPIMNWLNFLNRNRHLNNVLIVRIQ